MRRCRLGLTKHSESGLTVLSEKVTHAATAYRK